MFSWNFYHPYAYYQLVGTYAFVGLIKFTDIYQQDAMQKFPTLPKAFWPLCGFWELLIAIFLVIGQTYYALLMNFILLGGVIYSILLIKDSTGVTAVAKTKGLAVIPTIITWLPALALADYEKYNAFLLMASSVIGALAGSFIEIKMDPKKK